MMRRMLAKMEELGGLQKGTHQQKLFAFFEKYYFSVIDNFSSMLYNEDGKMYEKMKLAMLKVHILTIPTHSGSRLVMVSLPRWRG